MRKLLHLQAMRLARLRVRIGPCELAAKIGTLHACLTERTACLASALAPELCASPRSTNRWNGEQTSEWRELCCTGRVHCPCRQRGRHLELGACGGSFGRERLLAGGELGPSGPPAAGPRPRGCSLLSELQLQLCHGALIAAGRRVRIRLIPRTQVQVQACTQVGVMVSG